jgi:hypothetical protein
MPILPLRGTPAAALFAALAVALAAVLAITLAAAQGGEAPVQPEPPPGEAAREKAPDGAAAAETVLVRGRVRLVGNSPFTELIITGEDGGDWYIDRGERKLLEGYQQRIVTVRGRAETREITLANGKHLETRRILRDLSLVDP